MKLFDSKKNARRRWQRRKEEEQKKKQEDEKDKDGMSGIISDNANKGNTMNYTE